MVFVDEARILVKAGDGGKGCESFYSDKMTRHRRPDGGDGGKGGDIVFVADGRIQTLLDFRFNQHHKADKGGNGGSKGKKGRDAEDCSLRVPVGTLIRDNATNLLIKDLVFDGQQVVAAKGGLGGRGNSHKKIPTSPQEGQALEIKLELKIIADVGLIGFPNAGKSTIISNISRVKSKIANYPFTTKQPILGIVQGDDFNFIVADLPGLIEGAHEGRGLGDRFLKHAERTKVLAHIIDMSGSEGRDPLEDYEKINYELKEYSGHLFGKHKIIVANKMDLPEAVKHLKRFKKKYKEEIFEVSALEQKGLDELVEAMKELLCLENSHAR